MSFLLPRSILRRKRKVRSLSEQAADAAAGACEATVAATVERERFDADAGDGCVAAALEIETEAALSGARAAMFLSGANVMRW